MFDMTWLYVWGKPVPFDVCCRGSHLTPITETTVTSGTLLPGCNWVLMEAWPSHCESCYHQPMAGNTGCVLEDLVIYYLWGITLSSLRCVISRPPLGRFAAYTDPFMLKPTHFGLEGGCPIKHTTYIRTHVGHVFEGLRMLHRVLLFERASDSYFHVSSCGMM